MSGSASAKRHGKLATRTKKAAAKRNARHNPIKKRSHTHVQLHSLPGRVMLVSLKGAIGHPARALAQFDDVKLVGALENAADMRDIVLQTGVAVLAAITGYPIGSEGTTVRGLVESVVAWHGIDVEALKAELHAEEIEEAKAAALEAQGKAITENPDYLEEEAAIANVEAGPGSEGK